MSVLKNVKNIVILLMLMTISFSPIYSYGSKNEDLGYTITRLKVRCDGSFLPIELYSIKNKKTKPLSIPIRESGVINLAQPIKVQTGIISVDGEANVSVFCKGPGMRSILSSKLISASLWDDLKMSPNDGGTKDLVVTISGKYASPKIQFHLESDL